MSPIPKKIRGDVLNFISNVCPKADSRMGNNCWFAPQLLGTYFRARHLGRTHVSANSIEAKCDFASRNSAYVLVHCFCVHIMSWGFSKKNDVLQAYDEQADFCTVIV